jgi:sigma-E factor negative regulatory protein RseA
VMQAVEAEPTVLAPRNISHKVNPVAKQLAGLAVAASVTAIAVLGVQTWRLQAGAEPAAAVAQIAPPVANAIRPVATVATDNAPLPAHVQSQINQYLLNHNQNALAAQRMLPYARIVGYATVDTAE